MPHKTFTGRHGFLFNGNRNAGALGSQINNMKNLKTQKLNHRYLRLKALIQLILYINNIWFILKNYQNLI